MIKLNINSPIGPGTVWLNREFIVAVTPHDGGSVVTVRSGYANDRSFFVKETPDDIVNAVRYDRSTRP